MGAIVMTSEGVRALERELEELRQELAEVEARVAQAMEQAGDASEVGEYLDAQREQELVEHRIAVLENWLEQARVLELPEARHEVAELGATTEFEDLATGQLSLFSLVSSPEASVAGGRLSIDSPVGHALLGHAAGDTVEVVTPKGRRRLRLLAVR